MGLKKIVIIGSGPSACSLAYFLEGFEILIIESSSLLRDKLCGGILIEESVEFLRELSLPERVFAKPKNLSLNYLDWDNNLQFMQKRAFQNIERKEFDNWLLKKAQKNQKMQIMQNSKVIEFSYTMRKFKIKVEQNSAIKEIESDFLIDASGAFSFIRKKKPRIYNAVQFEVELNEEINSFDYILDSELNDYYSWRIPKGNKFLIGSAFNKNIKEKIEIFKKKFSEKFGIKEFKNLRAAPIVKPSTMEDICLVENKCFVLGEAAGLISASTGEGISYALRSGKECAKALNENSNNLEKALQAYKKNSEYLVKDVMEKIEKGKVLANPKKRLFFFKSLNK